MKILHTSDWHLGKTIHGQDLTQDQIFVLDQIEKEVGKGYSALIIAGDIYDRSVPPSQTVEILGSFIDRITENGIEVVMIPGNHDSPSRLDFASGVLRRSGMHVRCRTEETSRPILIRGKNNETVQIFALPFVEESQVRTDHPESGVRTHEDAVRYLISGMHENKIPDIPSILVAHEYTGRGLIRSDSERELLLGNQGLVDAEIFAGFDYVALGHLHRPQCASGSANAYYSGSIMPYSFSEADHRKLMYSLRISEGRIEKSDVEIKLLKKFSVLEGRMEDLVTSPEYDEFMDDYVSIRLKDTSPLMDIQSKLRARFNHILEIIQESIMYDDDIASSEIRKALDHPKELFSLFLDSFGWKEEMKERAMEIFREARTSLDTRGREVID